MLNNIQLDNILFLDIETVPETEHFSDLDSDFQELFAHKNAVTLRLKTLQND